MNNRLERQVAARDQATTIWQAARSAMDSHAYLTRKGVKSLGLREHRGKLVIPMCDGQGLHSLQFIAADGGKKFLPGGRVGGSYFLIGNPNGALCIAEGYATAASIHEATGFAVAVAFNAQNLLPVAQALRARFSDLRLILCADDDAKTHGNPGMREARKAAIAVGGVVAMPDFGVNRPDDATDFNDLHRHRGVDAVRSCVAAAQVVAERSNAPGRNSNQEKPTMQGTEAFCPPVEPWPDPVEGATLLDELAATVRRYMALPPHADTAVAIWALYTHCFAAFDITPRLNIRSPEKGCGKTTLLDLLELLTARPMRLDGLTTAVYFRLIEKHCPTLLVDEYDSFLRENLELRGALNSGYRRGGKIARVEGDAREPRVFNVYSAAALAGIGALPGTLQDRSIVITLKRAKRGEVRSRLDLRHTATEKELARKAARWALDHVAKLRAADPEPPPGFINRRADNWRALLAVADACGTAWGARARSAALALSGTEDVEESGPAIKLLADVREIVRREVPQCGIESVRLLERLNALPESPWSTQNKGLPMTSHQLAGMLRGFQVRPKALRLPSSSGKPVKGYARPGLEDAFDRYLPPESVTQLQVIGGADLERVRDGYTSEASNRDPRAKAA